MARVAVVVVIVVNRLPVVVHIVLFLVLVAFLV